MLCRMPAVSLPDDLRAELNKSESGTINNIQGPGVAAYVSSDGRTRVDIYIGLKMDGLSRYQNISSVYPNITVQFALKPVVFCKYDDIDFDPNKDTAIAIKVNRIYFAVRKRNKISVSNLLIHIFRFVNQCCPEMSDVISRGCPPFCYL